MSCHVRTTFQKQQGKFVLTIVLEVFPNPQ